MKSGMSKVIHIFILVFLLIFTLPETVHTDETREYAHEDSVSAWMRSIDTVGLDAGVVCTNDYDTGFGFGARLNQRFSSHSLNLISAIHFWGASTDSTDISVLGIAESLLLRKQVNRKIMGYIGLTVGYYYSHKKSNPELALHSPAGKKINSLDTFLTLGAEYPLPANCSLFIQVNYGSTRISDELHMNLSLNFDPGNLKKQME